MIMAVHTRQKFVCYPSAARRRIRRTDAPSTFNAELRYGRAASSESEPAKTCSKPGRLRVIPAPFRGRRFDCARRAGRLSVPPERNVVFRLSRNLRSLATRLEPPAR